MRLVEAIHILTDWDRKGRVLFTREDLRKLFPHDRDAAFKAGLSRLVSFGVMHRVARGLFVFALTKRRDPSLLEQIAVALRRGPLQLLEPGIGAIGVRCDFAGPSRRDHCHDDGPYWHI